MRSVWRHHGCPAGVVCSPHSCVAHPLAPHTPNPSRTVCLLKCLFAGGGEQDTTLAALSLMQSYYCGFTSWLLWI
ncbi:hypothetical protein GN956_G7060 [Arapaima gigas]